MNFILQSLEYSNSHQGQTESIIFLIINIKKKMLTSVKNMLTYTC